MAAPCFCTQVLFRTVLHLANSFTLSLKRERETINKQRGDGETFLKKAKKWFPLVYFENITKKQGTALNEVL